MSSQNFNSPATKFFYNILLRGIDSTGGILRDRSDRIKMENSAMEHTSMILSQTVTWILDGEPLEKPFPVLNAVEKDEMINLGLKGLLIPISPNNLIKIFESIN